MKKFLCCVVALLVFCLPFFSFQSIESKADIDNISATVADYDIENYPTANYFDVTAFRPYSQPPNNSITAVSNGLVNSIIISSSVAPDSPSGSNGYTVTNVKLGQACPYLQVGETYTLSAESESLIKQFIITNYNGISVSWNFGSSLTITEDYLNYWVIMYGFYIQAGQSAGDCRISKIMINRGEVAYPYSPYFYNIYDSGYGSGQEYGYNNGYNIGYTQGQESVSNFYSGTAEIYGLTDWYTYTKIADISSSYSKYSVSFSNFPNTVSSYTLYAIRYQFDTSYNGIDLGFKDNSFYVSHNALPVVTNSLGVVSHTNPAIYVGHAGLWDDNYQGALLTPYNIINDMCTIQYLNLSSFYIFNDFKNLDIYGDTLYIFCTDYNVLRSCSFGRNSSAKDSFNHGYTNGYNIGYTDGNRNANDTLYQQGYNAGLKSSQGFYGLLTAVFDVPVQAFTGLLNFNVLGVNMVDFVTSMLTLCIFIIILRLFI